MKRLLLALALVCACPLTAVAGHSWDMTEKTQFAAVTVVRLADMAQTLQIARHATTIEPGYVYSETNPLLGAHPSVASVAGYFLASHAVLYFAADYLPPVYRKMFLTGALTISASYVQNNASLGLKIGF